MVTLAIGLALFPVAGQAQHIYNKERDEQAQAVLPLAQALKNGEIFERQLKNLASLTRKDFETEFLITKFQINSFTLNLLTWGDAHELVCQTEAINTDPGINPTPAEIEKALEDLKTQIQSAKDSLKAFKESVKLNEEKKGDEEEAKDESVLTTLFSRLGDLGALQDFAEKASQSNPNLVNTKTVETIGEIAEIMGTLKKVYDAYTAKVKGFNELNAQLADLRVVLKKVAIQSLQVDEEHWKNIASIRARREADRADLLALISQYKGIVTRLKLVEFDSRVNDPVSPGNFCVAARRAQNVVDGVDIRPRQLITEYLKEIVPRAQNLQKDNEKVLHEAKAALRLLRNRSTPAEIRTGVQVTVDALSNSVKHIRSEEILSQLELEITDGDQHPDNYPFKDKSDKGLVGDLNALAAAADDASIDQALRFVIIHAQKNTARIRNMIADVPQALYVVAALIARGSTPNKLADVRLAQELHAYSIRKSAVRARAYELTITTGAQRLALFHKGGIKPTDVAELVFAASNIAITPAILAR